MRGGVPREPAVFVLFCAHGKLALSYTHTYTEVDADQKLLQFVVGGVPADSAPRTAPTTSHYHREQGEERLEMLLSFQLLVLFHSVQINRDLCADSLSLSMKTAFHFSLFSVFVIRHAL